jgi:dUTP pyrophosphatase
MSIIEYKRLDPSISRPMRLNSNDAGIDLRSCEEYVLAPQERMLIRTGISLKIPDGYYGRIAPRSGLAIKHGIDVLAGVIDAGYRGEIGVVLHNTDKDNSFNIHKDDRVAQLIIEKCYNMEFIEVENIDHSPRGNNGFGSSGVL